MPQENWKSKWKVVRELTPGGQGYTYLVHPASDTSANARFVLKQLKDQKTKERRERMLQEVTNLRLLDHLGVAKFVDSNADQYKTDESLYLVTEYIEGPDL